MAILYDYHMHSSFSGDSTAPMEQMIEAAVSRGLKGICITEHLDLDYPVSASCPPGFFELDVPAYRDYFLKLQPKYTQNIELFWGVELGLQPHLAETLSSIVRNNPFDFVLGSVHTCHAKDPYFPEFYIGREEEACYREYFTCVLENLEAYDNFDSLAHLDYVVRYGPNKDSCYTYDRYKDLLDPILLKLISMGKAIECNTGAINYGLRALNPSKDILKRYLALGGEQVTIGCDSHRPDAVANGFDFARDYLADCGFTHYTTFKERQAVMRKL